MAPIHPAFVHYPLALLTLSVVADVVSLWRDSPAARSIGFWSLVGAALGANASVIAGLYDMEAAGGHDALLHLHMRIGIGLLIAIAPLTWWRYRVHRRAARAPAPYVVLVSVGLAGMYIQGFIGGELVFDRGVGVDTGAVARASEEHDDGDDKKTEDVKNGDQARGDGHTHDEGEAKRQRPREVPEGHAHGNGEKKGVGEGEQEPKAGDQPRAESDAHAEHAPAQPTKPKATTSTPPDRPQAEDEPDDDRDETPEQGEATRGRFPILERRPSIQRFAVPWPWTPTAPSSTATSGPKHPASPDANAPPLYQPPASLAPGPLASVPAPEQAEAVPARGDAGHEVHE